MRRGYGESSRKRLATATRYCPSTRREQGAMVGRREGCGPDRVTGRFEVRARGWLLWIPYAGTVHDPFRPCRVHRFVRRLAAQGSQLLSSPETASETARPLLPWRCEATERGHGGDVDGVGAEG